jgi:hypothetical protein
MLIYHTFQENQCISKVHVECMVCFGERENAPSSSFAVRAAHL